jgi:hypothetical protein
MVGFRYQSRTALRDRFPSGNDDPMIQAQKYRRNDPVRRHTFDPRRLREIEPFVTRRPLFASMLERAAPSGAISHAESRNERPDLNHFYLSAYEIQIHSLQRAAVHASPTVSVCEGLTPGTLDKTHTFTDKAGRPRIKPSKSCSLIDAKCCTSPLPYPLSTRQRSVCKRLPNDLLGVLHERLLPEIPIDAVDIPARLYSHCSGGGSRLTKPGIPWETLSYRAEDRSCRCRVGQSTRGVDRGRAFRCLPEPRRIIARSGL